MLQRSVAKIYIYIYTMVIELVHNGVESRLSILEFAAERGNCAELCFFFCSLYHVILSEIFVSTNLRTMIIAARSPGSLSALLSRTLSSVASCHQNLHSQLLLQQQPLALPFISPSLIIRKESQPSVPDGDWWNLHQASTAKVLAILFPDLAMIEHSTLQYLQLIFSCLMSIKVDNLAFFQLLPFFKLFQLLFIVSSSLPTYHAMNTAKQNKPRCKFGMDTRAPAKQDFLYSREKSIMTRLSGFIFKLGSKMLLPS